MEQSETNENAAIEFVEAREATPAVTSARSVAGPVITQGAPGCPTCGGVAGAQNGGTATSSYVYALGQIETRFPRPSTEKEMAQATGRAETAGQTDQQAFHHVLSRREHRYLARHLCWILRARNVHPSTARPGGPRSSHRRRATAANPVDQHGHRRARPCCPTGVLQRADDPDRGIRPDL